MKRSRFTRKPSETEEMVIMEYKGRYFEVPRSEYHRRLTHIDQAQRSKQIQAVSRIRCDVVSTSHGPNTSGPEDHRPKNTDMVTSFFDQLEQSFKKSMERPEPVEDAPKPLPQEPKTTLENHFTLEDCNESSQQTIVERRIERESKCPTAVESTTSVPRDPRLFGEVADSLAQLKSTVTDLIDRTIVDIESKASLSQNVSRETVLMKRSFGEGRSSVQNSESYAQSKKAIRNKLYGEIEEIIKRLQDIEFLE